jgi:hypothetical protein
MPSWGRSYRPNVYLAVNPAILPTPPPTLLGALRPVENSSPIKRVKVTSPSPFHLFRHDHHPLRHPRISRSASRYFLRRFSHAKPFCAPRFLSFQRLRDVQGPQVAGALVARAAKGLSRPAASTLLRFIIASARIRISNLEQSRHFSFCES